MRFAMQTDIASCAIQAQRLFDKNPEQAAWQLAQLAIQELGCRTWAAMARNSSLYLLIRLVVGAVSPKAFSFCDLTPLHRAF